MPNLTTETSISLHYLIKNLLPNIIITSTEQHGDLYERWKFDIFRKFPLYKSTKENTELFESLINQHNLYKLLLGSSKCALTEVILETLVRLFRYQYFALLNGENILLSRGDYHELLDHVIDDNINGLIERVVSHLEHSEVAINRAICKIK